jgi:hypothetical protein
VTGEEEKAIVSEKKEVAPVEKKGMTPVKNSGVKNTVAAKPEVKTAPAVTEEKKIANKPVVKKKKKKLDYRDFSRGRPIREDHVKLEVEPVKEVKKVEIKQEL